MIINQIGSGGGSPEYITYSGTFSRYDDSYGSDFTANIDVGAELGDDFSIILMAASAHATDTCFVAFMQKPFGASAITKENRILSDADSEDVSFGSPDYMNSSRTEDWAVTKSGNVITISGSTKEDDGVTWRDVYEFGGTYRWYVTTTA